MLFVKAQLTFVCYLLTVVVKTTKQRHKSCKRKRFHFVRGPPRSTFDRRNCIFDHKNYRLSARARNIQQFEWAQIHTGMCVMQSSREQKSSGCQLGSGVVFRIEPSLVAVPAHLWEKLKNGRTRGWATEA